MTRDGLVLPALLTALALMLYAATTIVVLRARQTYGIAAPTLDGDERFARLHRIQHNTMEQLVLFLPSLWLFSVFDSPTIGAAGGAVWLAARLHFAWAYARDPKQRFPGFALSLIVSLALLFGSFRPILSSMW